MAESETKATSETSTVFSEEQLEQIPKMLSASLSSSTSLMEKNGTIMTAFGGLTEKVVAGVGTVKISPDISLQAVLHDQILG
ncbi:hypothetical protein CK203_012053 [Vitis vinifera]|uniref:Uncharacterized protein n=1 Tax=Vitis vinifera TaxID=29760 RepID=A0A438K0U1_VITVI|nr:hypothetical protein CK203_012053 [Vitis vinifera]